MPAESVRRSLEGFRTGEDRIFLESTNRNLGIVLAQKDPEKLRFTARTIEGKRIGELTLIPDEGDKAKAEVKYEHDGDTVDIALGSKALGLLTFRALNNMGYKELVGRCDLRNKNLGSVFDHVRYFVVEEGEGELIYTCEASPNDSGTSSVIVEEIKGVGKYPNGLPKARVSTRNYLHLDNRIVSLSGSDKYGGSVFGVTMQVIETDRDFQRARVVEWDDDLPVVVDIENKNYRTIPNRRKELHIKHLKPREVEFERAIYRYDEQGRLVGKSLFSRAKVNNGDKEILSPKEEVVATYDDENRLKAVGEYGFNGDGQRYLRKAKLWHYEAPSGGMVRITESSYGIGLFSEAKRILYRDATSVLEIDTQTGEYLAAATYDDERYFRELRMTNQDFIRKNPVNVLLRKKPQEPLLERWREEEEKKFKRSIDEISVPTFITGEDYEAYIAGADFYEVGGSLVDPEQRQIYFQDFLDEVGSSTDDEVIQIITDLLLGKLKVPLFWPPAEQLGDKEGEKQAYIDLHEKCQSMSILQKTAVAAHFIPDMVPFILDITHNPLPVLAHLTFIIDYIVDLDRQSRITAIRNYVLANYNNLTEEQIIALKVVRDLDRFQKILFENEGVFEKVLKSGKDYL